MFPRIFDNRRHNASVLDTSIIEAPLTFVYDLIVHHLGRNSEGSSALSFLGMKIVRLLNNSFGKPPVAIINLQVNQVHSGLSHIFCVRITF